MLECNVVVSEELARKALIKNSVLAVSVTQLIYHAHLFLVIWVAVAIVDTINNQGTLISQHGVILLCVLLAVVLYDSTHWYLTNRNKFQGGSYTLKVDSEGFIFSMPDTRVQWFKCLHYRDYADYMLVVMLPHHRFVLPKTTATADVLQYIRENVPKR